jgi:TonB family protein
VEEKPFFSVAGALAGMESNVPKPEYPVEIQNAGVTGPITVKIRVNKNGRVISAVSTSGDQRLRAIAVKAAKEATFDPEKLAEISPRGRAVTGSITYEFAALQTDGATAPATTSTVEKSAPSPAAITSNADPNSPVVGSELANAVNNVPTADYPSRARRAGIGGTITVTIRVNRAGKVTSWRSSAGNAQLRAAAIKAARRATFSPEKLPGSGDILGSITYNFTP